MLSVMLARNMTVVRRAVDALYRLAEKEGKIAF